LEAWFSAVHSNSLGLLVVGLLWLHRIESLANVTMATIANGKVGKLVLPRTSCSKNDTAMLLLRTEQQYHTILRILFQQLIK
jgi:hypothetical protein